VGGVTKGFGRRSRAVEALAALGGQSVRAAAGGDGDVPVGLEVVALSIDRDRMPAEHLGEAGDRPSVPRGERLQDLPFEPLLYVSVRSTSASDIRLVLAGARPDLRRVGTVAS
jgi:hypothetical protein